MANLKLGGLVTEISGKIGGQSLANLGNHATIKNITQRNTIPTSKQAKQRFITGQLSNAWTQLTQAQRDGWEATSVNYTWYNNVGVQVTRNGFQTFSFLNQNLILLGIAPNSNAPAYVPVAIPKINIIDISSGKFTIQSNNTSSVYLYALFGAPNLPKGVTYAKNRMKFCGYITSAQLLAGYDVIASLEAVFGTLTFPNKISIIVDPINQTTGNRNQFTTEIQNIDKPMVIEVVVADGATVTMPFGSGGVYDYQIDWSDGTVTSGTAFNGAGASHTYVNGGTYRISIFGVFTRFVVSAATFKAQLTNVYQFGYNKFQNLRFFGCTLLTVISANDTPSIAATPTWSQMFDGCINLTAVNNIAYWDVSLVTSFSLFFNLTDFNGDLSKWNVGAGTNFSSMFLGSLFNGNISSWNMSAATTINGMFHSCPFNQDISGWDVSNVTNFGGLFRSNTAFNQNISGWNVSKGTIFESMVRSSVCNQNFANWIINLATNMTFFGAGNTAWSVTNWNNTLIGWAALSTVPTGITISVKPVATGAGITAKNFLVASKGWTINENVN